MNNLVLDFSQKLSLDGFKIVFKNGIKHQPDQSFKVSLD
jgi:hypothetical protein